MVARQRAPRSHLPGAPVPASILQTRPYPTGGFALHAEGGCAIAHDGGPRRGRQGRWVVAVSVLPMGAPLGGLAPLGSGSGSGSVALSPGRLGRFSPRRFGRRRGGGRSRRVRVPDAEDPAAVLGEGGGVGDDRDAL